MLQRTNFITGLLLVAFLFSTCGKYEEGPGISLRSKKARVANVWQVEYAYDHEDNEDITADFLGETWEFTKDGQFVERDNGTVDKKGAWSFVNDKENLRIDVPNDVEVYKILKLKENEMWLDEKGEEELHLVPAN